MFDFLFQVTRMIDQLVGLAIGLAFYLFVAWVIFMAISLLWLFIKERVKL